MADSKGKVSFVFINGGPASGKDTQAELLAANMPNSYVISPGHILRNLSTLHTKSPYKDYFDINTVNLKLKLIHGRNVDGKTLTGGLINLVDQRLNEGKRNFFFAGYPREERSYWGISMFVEELRRSGRFDRVQNQLVYLNVTEGELWKRFDERVRKAIESGEDVRHDDLHGEFEDRIRTFMDNASPLLEDIAAEGKLIVVDGNATVEETNRDLVWALGLQKMSSIEGVPQSPRMRK